MEQTNIGQIETKPIFREDGRGMILEAYVGF
jgi:hypothetical protein